MVGIPLAFRHWRILHVCSSLRADIARGTSEGGAQRRQKLLLAMGTFTNLRFASPGGDILSSSTVSVTRMAKVESSSITTRNGAIQREMQDAYRKLICANVERKVSRRTVRLVTCSSTLSWSSSGSPMEFRGWGWGGGVSGGDGCALQLASLYCHGRSLLHMVAMVAKHLLSSCCLSLERSEPPFLFSRRLFLQRTGVAVHRKKMFHHHQRQRHRV